MIAGRYADALFQAVSAQDPATLERVDGELTDVAAMLRDNPQLDRLWKHPVIQKSDKQLMVRQLMAGKVHPYTLNLLLLLFDKKRGNLITPVQQAFRERFNATRRRATVLVTSALPVDATQCDALRAQLSASLAKEIEMETVIDPDLIGGLIVQIEDQVIDNSLRGRLAALRHSLA